MNKSLLSVQEILGCEGETERETVGCCSEGNQGKGGRCRNVWKLRLFSDDSNNYDDNNKRFLFSVLTC